MLPTVFACESESLIPPPADHSELYWELELNHRAVTLATPASAPFDTLTLVATPKSATGEFLAGFPPPQYISRDGDRVMIRSDGILRAMAPTTAPVWVIATVTANNLKHSDSVLVRVANTSAPPVLASFSIQPVPPDSAKVFSVPALMRGTISSRIVPVRALDASDTPIANVPVYFRSSDPTTAVVDRVTGGILGLRPGTATVYASTTVYGVTKADTLTYTIGKSLFGSVRLVRSGSTYMFFPSEITVTAGALVSFSTSDIVFDDDTSSTDITFAGAGLPYIAAAETGLHLGGFVSFFGSPTLAAQCIGDIFIPRIDCTSAGSFLISTDARLSPIRYKAYRVFPVPGTYEFHSAIRGISGRVVVVPEN